MQIGTGFWAASTLATAVEIDLFSRIDRAGGLTREQAAKELGFEDRPTDLFLAGCASLGLLDKDGESYVNTALAETFLIPGRPGYFGGFIRYINRDYTAWHKLGTALSTNSPTAWDPRTQDHPFAAEDPVILNLFWEAMHSLSVFTGRAIAGALPELGKFRALMDVGGGSGVIPIEVCRAFPALRATVYDLPFVCDIAAGKIEDAGMSTRIATAPGDFLADQSLPSGHDVILLSSILHNWNEETDRSLLAKCFAALPSGGALIISEILLNDQRTGPAEAALMGLTMLVGTKGGKNYSGSEYTTWLSETGFENIRVVPCESAGTNGTIIGYKP
jgi:hypothetical protein